MQVTAIEETEVQQERDSVVKRISTDVWKRISVYGKFEETPSIVLERILDRLDELEAKEIKK
jgi:hypothetical protein